MCPAGVRAATHFDPDHTQSAVTVLEAQCSWVGSNTTIFIGMTTKHTELWQSIDGICYLLSPNREGRVRAVAWRVDDIPAWQLELTSVSHLNCEVGYPWAGRVINDNSKLWVSAVDIEGDK